MKIKIALAVLLGLSAFAFVFKSVEYNNSKKENYSVSPPTVQQSSGFTDSFFVGALNCGAQTNFDQYDSLKFNLWSCYRGPYTGWTRYVPGDVLDAPYSSYGVGVENLCKDNLSQHSMRTLMDRTKITYLGYGARSDYQCESEEFYKQNNPNPDYWFYTYNTHQIGKDTVDNTTFGNGVKVRFCGYGIHDTGYVVKNLKCNREQIDMDGDDWICDIAHKWYVKPRIRIDSNYAQNNPDILVCRIEIVKWSGDTLKTVNIKGRNFLDGGFHYDGRYLEEFNFSPDSSRLYFGPGDEMNTGHHPAWDTTGCRVDYRVYWYGNCDMWIDYVRVENETAKDLLSNDPSNLNYIKFQNWLQWEADIAKNSDGAPLQFYMEEWEFNHLPCMKYVSRKLDSLTNHKYNLMCVLNYERMFYHIPPALNIYKNLDAGYVESVSFHNLPDQKG